MWKWIYAHAVVFFRRAMEIKALMETGYLCIVLIMEPEMEPSPEASFFILSYPIILLDDHGIS